MKTFNSASQAVDYYTQNGYTNDFQLKENHLWDATRDIAIQPDDIRVDAIYRFEGMTNPDDTSIFFAITLDDGNQGTMLQPYGVDSIYITPEMREALTLKKA